MINKIITDLEKVYKNLEKVQDWDYRHIGDTTYDLENPSLYDFGSGLIVRSKSTGDSYCAVHDNCKYEVFDIFKERGDSTYSMFVHEEHKSNYIKIPLELSEEEWFELILVNTVNLTLTYKNYLLMTQIFKFFIWDDDNIY